MKTLAFVTFVVVLVLVGCAMDTAPTGLRRTPEGDGPLVVFDLAHRPLPQIPQPNDVATVADPSSRTGRRLNVSLVAPTQLETRAREGFDSMEGWGTTAPITASFSAPLDLEAIRARMQRDGHDFSDDPVYVVNLATGVPVVLDMGDGNFPVPVFKPDAYYPNDPRASAQTLELETAEEGAGLSQADYTPARDTDFDGVLDHPNTIAPRGPVPGGGAPIAGVDDVMTWYERQTDTLILRPLLPLEEKTEYAVVLTDRLQGANGAPVRSPFPFVHHPEQRDAAAKVQAILSDPSRAAYYGSLSGTGLDHVAFTWSFTTQPVYEDLRELRDGLHGVGPFARLAADFPTHVEAFRAVGLARDPRDEPAGFEQDPKCAPWIKQPYVMRPEAVKDAVHTMLQKLLPFSAEEAASLEASLASVDHVVLGTYQTPYFLGDPDHEDPDARFELDFRTGEGRVSRDTGHFFLAVPKTKDGKKPTQPFPVVLWAHGSWNNDAEILARAGWFAKQGLATFGIDLPGHGLNAAMTQGLQEVAESLFAPGCLVPFVNGLASGRARDLDGDGTPDSGLLVWSAHIFHTRDNFRQGVVDEFQAARILASFGSAREADYDGDGKPELTGDFDADGVPDVGGTSPIFTSGNSLGGILAQIHGALDTHVTASGPISGSGGLAAATLRSSLVVDPVLEQVFSPLVVAVPASSRPADATNGTKQTQCAGDDRSVRFVVNDLNGSREIEIACLHPDELAEGMTVVATNLRTATAKCARTGKGGTFRVPVPASVGDRLDIQVFTKPDVVRSYDGCALADGAVASAGRRITTWEQAATQFTAVADSSAASCEAVASPDAPSACQQFRATFYAVGDPLVVPQEGLGLLRQSPDFRQLMTLSQAALDPAEPLNFARYYALAPLPGLDGAPIGPRPLLTSYTVGDDVVPIATGYAFARAAGVLPFLAPSFATRYPEYAAYATPPALYAAFGNKTPNDVLLENGAVEGTSRLKRTPAGPRCAANYVPGKVAGECTGSASRSADECARTLFDSDWHAEGADLYDQRHPAVPLRLVRAEDVKVASAADLDRAWAPRIQGAPFQPDGAYVPKGPLLGLVSAYVNPTGQHVWGTGDPCKAWDDAVYYDHLLARFFVSGGTDVYFTSHPKTHGCLANESCDFLK